jgi:sugar phosphate isomerase/epimerase
MKLSLMTYGLGQSIGRSELLQALREAGFEGVEWRLDQNQPHGIEIALDAAGRRRAADDCREAGIRIVGIASGNRYHVTDPAELRGEIEATRQRIDLAADLGAPHCATMRGRRMSRSAWSCMASSPGNTAHRSPSRSRTKTWA